MASSSLASGGCAGGGCVAANINTTEAGAEEVSSPQPGPGPGLALTLALCSLAFHRVYTE